MRYLNYTALGDSLTVGVGSLFSPGFEKRYVKLAEQSLHQPIHVEIFAKNGATTPDVLHRLQENEVRQSIFHAHIITITAGGNDLMQAARIFKKTQTYTVFRQTLHKGIENLSKIIHKIFLIKSTSKTPFIIRIVDLYNPFPKIPYSDFWVGLFNKHLKTLAANNVKVTNIYPSFQHAGSKLLSFDGLHPNGKGYQVIAGALHRLGYRGLV